MGFIDQIVLLFRKAVYAHLPFTYKHLSQEKVHKTLGYVMFVLALGLFIMCLTILPTLSDLPGFFQEQIGKFETFKLNGEIVQNDPIYLPRDDPQIVIDASGKEPYGGEMFKLTSENLFFHLSTKPQKIRVANILDPTTHPLEASKIIVLLVMFLLPSILFYAYLFLLIKYAFVILLSSIVLFTIVRVMLLIRISCLRTFNIAAYAATPMILIEVISIPFNPKFLFPLFKYMGMTFYATTFLIYLIFLISGFLLVEDGVIQGFVEEKDAQSQPFASKGTKK